MAKSIREGEKFPPSSIATFREHLPSKSAADVRNEDAGSRSNELLQMMRDAKLTRTEYIYLTAICNYGNSRIEAFCRGRKYNPQLQVPTTQLGRFSQANAVFMRLADGELYRRAINLMRRADRYVYDGTRIEVGGTLPHGWTRDDQRLVDMIVAREELDEILAGERFQSYAKVLSVQSEAA